MTAHAYTKKTRVFSGPTLNESIAVTSHGGQTGNSTNASGVGLGIRARGNAIATSYDKFAKKQVDRNHLVNGAASYDYLNGGPDTSRGKTLMNIAEGVNTITSNMSFPGISSEVDSRLRHKQKHNG